MRIAIRPLTAILFLGFFFLRFFFLEAQTLLSVAKENPFGNEPGLLPEDIATFPELHTWALYQFYDLDEDNPAFGLQDSICRMVPSSGLKFSLAKDSQEPVPMTLVLDLTKYRPQPQARFKSRSLSIYVNGNWKKTVQITKQKNFSNPVHLKLDPSEIPGAFVSIELRPSQNEVGRFWGIWDAFLVKGEFP